MYRSKNLEASTPYKYICNVSSQGLVHKVQPSKCDEVPTKPRIKTLSISTLNSQF